MSHDYKPFGPPAEWSDTYKCARCGAGPWTYAAEDCVSASRLNELDKSPCVLPAGLQGGGAGAQSSAEKTEGENSGDGK